MRALAWNCRGANSKNFTANPYIRWLVTKTNPGFVFLSETKCSASNLSTIFNKWGCKGSTGVDALNFSGGLFCSLVLHESSKLAKCQGFVAILGDFNQVEFSDQKKGGSGYLLGFNTWCNNKEGSELIYEQLDQAYCNEAWRCLFSDTSILNFEILVSDHAAILLESSPLKSKRKSLIK
ncbi:E3 ubiquitin-protein ligase SGR9 amyloplastic [Bienertia sinuspersici]